jgi:hypothetical protein
MTDLSPRIRQSNTEKVALFINIDTKIKGKGIDSAYRHGRVYKQIAQDGDLPCAFEKLVS